MSTWVLTYNGELNNYPEVRRDLESGGEGFRTASDTEVFLRAILRTGLDAQDRCEGMWALAMYEERTGRLIPSGDRFGEKPLFVFQENGCDHHLAYLQEVHRDDNPGRGRVTVRVPRTPSRVKIRPGTRSIPRRTSTPK